MKKFWNWKNMTATNQETQEQIQENDLFPGGCWDSLTVRENSGRGLFTLEESRMDDDWNCQPGGLYALCIIQALYRVIQGGVDEKCELSPKAV